MSFKSVQKGIAKKDKVSAKSAGAILASATRKASPAAKAANPKLKKVKMPSASKAKGMSTQALGQALSPAGQTYQP